VRSGIVLALAALAASGAPLAAGALDLTGTWTGKYTCTEYDGTLSRFTVRDDVLAISQSGFELAVDSTSAFSGVAIADARAPEGRGEAKLAACSTDAAVSNGGDALARLKVKLDREKGRGKLKGVSLYAGPGLVGSCRWSYKLTDPANPGAAGCN
jgi:hypothetical protein